MPPATPPRPAVSPADGSVSRDWTLHTLATTPSTNLAARTLAPWHAVRSDIQTGGYGRTGRSWVSDTGGLWLSAVLPCPGPREPWSILPLAAGWAVIKALNGLHVSGLRLRWPNDILSDQRKLAGLLVERHSADTAIVGIGINIFNSAETADPVLHGMTTRLADLIDLGDRTLGHGVLCIHCEVQEDLLHHAPVGVQDGQPESRLKSDVNFFTRQAAQHPHQVLNQRVQVERFSVEDSATAENEELMGQVCGPVCVGGKFL